MDYNERFSTVMDSSLMHFLSLATSFFLPPVVHTFKKIIPSAFNLGINQNT